MGLVLAICGMPASGKGEFASVLANRGIPVRSMGDMVRAEVNRLGLAESPNIFGDVASSLREQFGDDILAVRLISVVDRLLQDNPIVLIEGMRGVAEKKIFMQHWGDKFLSIGITASKETRFQRVLSRNRAEDGDRDSFETRDEREKGWGLESIIEESDIIFSNDDELVDLSFLVSTWLDNLRLGP